jgi:inorganic pyrophosphatase
MKDNDFPVLAYIEIEKHTNVKYEYCKKSNCLEIDRILPYPFFYPYAYGFIPNTLAADNDELDILIITPDYEKNNFTPLRISNAHGNVGDLCKKDQYYDVYIIGVLLMEDEKGEDHKILAVLEEDYKIIKDVSDLDDKIKNDLIWFFSNYKSSTHGKWSRVSGIENKETAMSIYLQSKKL